MKDLARIICTLGCGVLLDNAIALRCVAATIVDLSVKGYLAIERSRRRHTIRQD